VRWLREYPIVPGGYAFDNPDNEFAADWPAYRQARAHGAVYVLRLGEIRSAAT
jgi:hypothetical protein